MSRHVVTIRAQATRLLVGCMTLSLGFGCTSSSGNATPPPSEPVVTVAKGSSKLVGAHGSSLSSAIAAAIQGFDGVAGVYVRRLGDETSVALRADELFPTASLVKVPILLKLLDRVDKNELAWSDPLVYSKKRLYPGDDLLARFEDGQKTNLAELVFLMESLSDNSASLWCQELAGGGSAINTWLEAKGFHQTRVNSRTPGREKDREAYGWGQTTPREMAELLVAIRERRAVSPGADVYADRALGRSFWVSESLSSFPPSVHVISKQGAINASRSEVLLVSAPSGAFVLCVITKSQKDQRWVPSNAGYRLLRTIAALCWQHFEPDRPYAPAIDGPTWPH